MRALILVLGIFLIHQSCVPARKADELRSQNDSLRQVVSESQQKNTRLSEKNDSLVELNKDQKRIITNLRQDTTLLGKSIRKQKKLNKELNQTYERLVSNKQEIISDKAGKSKDLLNELNQKKRDLEAKEQTLNKKARKLDRKTWELDSVKKRLKTRETFIHRLREIVANKEATLDTLQKNLSDTLKNYNEDEVTVEKQDNMVNVRFSEKLFYDSGRYKVNDSAKANLGKFADVVSANPAIDILVKSYTNDLPMEDACKAADQNDLSRLRANEVVSYLSTEGALEAGRLSSAGLGLRGYSDGKVAFILTIESSRVAELIHSYTEK